MNDYEERNAAVDNISICLAISLIVLLASNIAWAVCLYYTVKL